MSFLTDLFKGNFGHLGKDIAHDPLGTAAVAIPLALMGGEFLLPELGAALGVGGAEAAGAGAAGGLGAVEAGGALGAEEAGLAGLGAGTAADVLGGITPGATALTGGGIGSDFASAAMAADAAIPGSATPTAFTGALDTAAGAAPGGGSAFLAGGGPAGVAEGGSTEGVLSGLGSANTAGGGIGSDILSWAKANPMFLASLGAGLGGTLLAPKLSGLINKVPQQGQLQNLAQQEQQLAQTQTQLGQQFTTPLLTGQLPPDAMASWQQATNDAINTTKARYANLGLSGSTMETDAIGQINNQAQAAKFSIASQMAQVGNQATSQAATAMGLQDQVFAQLMQAQVAQDTALQQAIARMAAGAALGTGMRAAQTQTT